MTLQNKFQLAAITILFGITIIASSPTFGAKVYKWFDDDGKITYRDKPPPAESGGKVEVKEIDSEHNVIQYHVPTTDSNNKKDPGNSAAGSGSGTTAGQSKNNNDANVNGRNAVIGIEEQRRLNAIPPPPPKPKMF